MKISRIESLGCYVPEKVVTVQQLMTQLRIRQDFDLEAVTGIKSKRQRSKTEDTYSISINAAKDCLKNSKYEPEDLDILITCSISRFTAEGDIIFEPSVSYMLKKAIGAKNARFFSVTNACAGMGTGVHLLNNMIKSGAVRNGMVVSGECLTGVSDTALMEIKDPIDIQFASLTIGDAGAALIMDVSPRPDEEYIEFTHFTTMAEFSDLCIALPSNETGNFAMYSDSIKMHSETLLRLPHFIHSAIIKKTGRTVLEYDTINHIISHQTSIKAMKAGQHILARHFETDPDYAEKVLIYDYIKTLGNTASTSNFVVLYSALKDGRIKKGHKVLLMIQGSGIVLGIIPVKIGDIKPGSQMEVKK